MKSTNMRLLKITKLLAAGIVLMVITACGGGTSSGSGGGPSTTYMVSGVVSGLNSGVQVTLQNNDGNPTTVSTNGAFAFTTPVAYNGSYAVTVGTQPTGQTCTVSGGSGSGIVANVYTVTVTCTTVYFTVGGTVSGLGNGNQVILQNNADTPITIAANGEFTFTAAVASGSKYSVIVKKPPTGMYCSVVSANSNNIRSNINNVAVNCFVPTTYVVSTLAGTVGTTGNIDGAGANATFWAPSGITVNANGDIYVADQGNHKIRKITPAGVVSTFAGSGAQGSTDGAVVNASFSYPVDVTLDNNGNLYVADSGNNKIRKITPDGVVSTLAGNGTQGSSDGTGVNASFNLPAGLAVDANGNVYVSDTANNKIRKITSAGSVSTLAGTGAVGSTDGDGISATFWNPTGVVVNTDGDIYVADRGSFKIRKVTPSGIVTTVAGVARLGSIDGVGAIASFNLPYGITLDENGIFYITDTNNNKIRSMNPQGVVSTIAGTGAIGSANGPVASATFFAPFGIAVDAAGNIYVSSDQCIRKISPQ